MQALIIMAMMDLVIESGLSIHIEPDDSHFSVCQSGECVPHDSQANIELIRRTYASVEWLSYEFRIKLPDKVQARVDKKCGEKWFDCAYACRQHAKNRLDFFIRNFPKESYRFSPQRSPCWVWTHNVKMNHEAFEILLAHPAVGEIETGIDSKEKIYELTGITEQD